MQGGPLTWRKKSLAFIVFSHSSGILPFSGEDLRNSCWLQPSSVSQYQIAGTESAVAMSLNRRFAFRHFVLSGIAPPSGDGCSTTQGHAESASRLTSCLALCLLSALGFGQTRQGNVSERAPAKYQGPPPEFFNSNTGGNPPVIAAGDVLSIRFFYAPELNKVVKVREDGKVSLDLFQGVPVAGQTLEDLQKKLVELYSREYTNPEVTVDFESRANNSVFVTGEVQLPGAKELKGNMTVGMVLAMSQVNQKTAGTKSLFLMRKIEDNKYGVYKLDASFPSGTAHVTNLIPGDILFVPRKGIVKAGDFIDHYARQLLPVTPGAGVYFVP